MGWIDLRERELRMNEIILLNSLTSEMFDITLRNSWFICILLDAEDGGVNPDADFWINSFISMRSVAVSSVKKQANSHELIAKQVVGMVHINPMINDA